MLRLSKPYRPTKTEQDLLDSVKSRLEVFESDLGRHEDMAEKVKLLPSTTKHVDKFALERSRVKAAQEAEFAAKREIDTLKSHIQE